jgi:hypothetical protein
MYKPTVATLQKLTKFFVGYREQEYIVHSILRQLKEVSKRGKIFIAGDAHLMILGVKTPRTLPAPELDLRSSFKSFELGTFRRKVFVTDEEMEDWDLPYTPIKHATGAVKENQNVEREYSISAWMRTKANFTNQFTAAVKYGAVGGGDAALADVDTAVGLIGGETGIVGTLSVDVWRAMRRSWQSDLIPAGEKDLMGLKAMALYAGIDEYVIGSAKYNTSSDPDNSSLVRMWGDGNCWYSRRASSDGESKHCFGVAADRKPKVISPRTNDPEGVKVIAKGQFSDVIINETKAVFFDTCV